MAICLPTKVSFFFHQLLSSGSHSPHTNAKNFLNVKSLSGEICLCVCVALKKLHIQLILKLISPSFIWHSFENQIDSHGAFIYAVSINTGSLFGFVVLIGSACWKLKTGCWVLYENAPSQILVVLKGGSLMTLLNRLGVLFGFAQVQKCFN